MLEGIDHQIDLPNIPEIESLRQFEVCARRIVESLPEKKRTRYTITLEGGAFTMAMALKELYRDADPRYPTPADHVIQERDFGKRGLTLARRMLWRLKDRQLGSPSDISVAFELLERVEPAFWREDIPSLRFTTVLDMFGACEHATDMPVMIQIRNVPDELHRTLKSRAALAGKSLSDYLLAELRRAAEYPTPEELKARIAALTPIEGVNPAELIRAGREERDRELDGG
ncbi:MAG TPA: hypothetical protein VMN78_00010 [Longimicrobiales bacterium]|nr:hypothetical protein [Longimicrobiales bacterium]